MNRDECIKNVQSLYQQGMIYTGIILAKDWVKSHWRDEYVCLEIAKGCYLIEAFFEAYYWAVQADDTEYMRRVEEKLKL